MPVDRLGTPTHIHAATCACTDNSRNFDDLAVCHQIDAGSKKCDTGHGCSTSAPGICPYAYGRQRAAHGFNLGRDFQITPRQKRRFPHISQLLDTARLRYLKTAAKILIRRNKCGVASIHICVGTRRPVAARIYVQSLLECRGHQ